jgi:hypothetical protein
VDLLPFSEVAVAIAVVIAVAVALAATIAVVVAVALAVVVAVALVVAVPLAVAIHAHRKGHSWMMTPKYQFLLGKRRDNLGDKIILSG